MSSTRDRFIRSARTSDWPAYLLGSLATLLLAFTSLQLWKARLDVPLSYSADALAVGSHFKTVLETGWYEFQPALGAPFGQTYNDFPTADNLHFMIARVLTLLTSNWAIALNLYFIIGFPLATIAAIWLLRRLGVSRLFSTVFGIVYALAPYHFSRGENHLWLASYYVVPFALALVIMTIRGENLWSFRDSGPWILRWATRRSAVTLAILVLTGTAQSYYAVFFLALIAFAGLARLIASGQWRRFWGAAIAGGITAMVMLINMSPDIIYSVVNGANPGGFARSHSESEIYALKLAQLLLPWADHRIGFLRNLRAAYDSQYPLLSENPALGALGALGLVILFLILAWIAASRGSKTRAPFDGPRFSLLSQLAALTFVAFLFSTVGGLATLISFLTTSLRGWNRMSIEIAMLSLAAGALLTDAGVNWLKGRRWAKPRARVVLAAASAVLIVGVAYIDQTPGDAGTNYAKTIAAFDADQAWFSSIEKSVPAGSMILQLPYEAFPESIGPTGVDNSEVMIPYLHSVDLRWSGGGIKGRPRSDWPYMLQQLPGAEIARLAAAAGFAGIHVDRASLTKTEDAMLEAALDRALDDKKVSASQRYVFYDLAALHSSLESEFGKDELADIGARVTNPVTLALGQGFGLSISDADVVVHPVIAPAPEMALVNERDTAVDVTVNLNLTTSEGGPTRVDLVLPDGSVKHVDLRGGEATVQLQLKVAPGTQRIGWSVPGDNQVPLTQVTITTFSCVERAVAAFAAK